MIMVIWYILLAHCFVMVISNKIQKVQQQQSLSSYFTFEEAPENTEKTPLFDHISLPQWPTRTFTSSDNSDVSYPSHLQSSSFLETSANDLGLGLGSSGFKHWDGTFLNENPLSQVSEFLDNQDRKYEELVKRHNDSRIESTGERFMSLLEIGQSTSIKMKKVHERGQPHLCAGLNPDYFVSCVENLESLLRADKAVTYWLRSGCMHLDREGPEIVKPCPAHDVGIVTPRNELAPMCPRDFKYLPRIPRKQATQ